MLLGEEVAKWVWLGISFGLFCLQGLCPLANECLCALQPGAKLEPQGRTGARAQAGGHSLILRHGGGTCSAESGSKAPPPPSPCLGTQTLQYKCLHREVPLLCVSPNVVRNSRLGQRKEAFSREAALAPSWAKRRERMLSLMKAECLLRFTRKHLLGSWWRVRYDEHVDSVGFVFNMLSYHLLPHSPAEYSRNRYCPIVKMGKLVKVSLLRSKWKPDVRSLMLGRC